jgi:hypothetical protein
MFTETWGRDRLRLLDMVDLYIIHCSGYACTYYATDVEKIKAAIMMKCNEKAKGAKYIKPHLTKQLESGLVELITPAMLEVIHVAFLEEGNRVQGGVGVAHGGVFRRKRSVRILFRGRKTVQKIYLVKMQLKPKW